uniref:Tumor protein p53-inducible nuclear protein 2 isoform X5 n=1 Tax=Pogona vitticeps TaxID=103695 RepID=A0ABM5G629_9SAUR
MFQRFTSLFFSESSAPGDLVEPKPFVSREEEEDGWLIIDIPVAVQENKKTSRGNEQSCATTTTNVKYLNAICNVMPHTTPPLLLPRPPSWRRSTRCVGFREQSSWQRSTSSVRKSCSGRTAPESAAHDGPNAKAALSTNHASVNTTTKLLQKSTLWGIILLTFTFTGS